MGNSPDKINSEKLFYRLCEGLTEGEFYSVDISPYEIINDLTKDWYKSVYLYTEQQVNNAEEIVEVQHKKTKQVYKRKRGIAKLVTTSGEHYPTVPGITNKIVFDFDDEKNPENAKRDLVELVGRLKKRGISVDNVDMVYSGNKGFHLSITTDTWFTASEHKSIALSLADGLLTKDVVVYNDSRVIRVPHTKHQKSGRFCTPIYADDLVLSMQEIEEIAGKSYDVNPDKRIVNLPAEIVELKNNIVEVEKKVVEAVGNSFEEMKDAISKLDFSKKLPNMQPAKWVLHEGFIPRGFGQEARMILAATYKSMLFCNRTAYRMLKTVSESRVMITGDANSAFDTDELWTNVIETVYSDHWQGGNYGIKHPLLAAIDEILPAYLKYDKTSESLVVDKDEAFSKFMNYAQNVDKNTISFGIPSLDANIRIMTKNVYGFLASPSVGKTSCALQIMENTSRDGIKASYFSFDMSLDDTYVKILTRHTKDDEATVLENLKSGDPEIVAKYKKLIDKYYSNVDFVFKPGLTIEDMEKAIVQREEETGVKTKLVVVDYLTLIKTPGADGNQKGIDAIQGLRYLAHNLNCAVFVLLQPNKLNSTPSDPIKSYNGIKGTSEIAEACTAILTAYREGFDPQSFENDRYLSIICVKNRKGRLFSLDFNWQGKTGLIRELENIERKQLAEYREMKKEAEAESRQNTRGNKYF